MWKNVNKTNSPSSPLDTKTQKTCVSESLATKSHDMKRGKINVRLRGVTLNYQFVSKAGF